MIVAVSEGAKLAVGDDVKVGSGVRVGRAVFVLADVAVLDGAIVVGGEVIPVSNGTLEGFWKAQPTIINKLITNTE